MKKKYLILPTLLGLISFSSCTINFNTSNSGNNEYSNTFKPTNEVVLLKELPNFSKPTQTELKEVGFTNFIDHFNYFSSSITEDYFNTYNGERGRNVSISPLSIYFAIAQAASCAANNTQTELFNSLEMSKDEVETYSSVLYRSCKEKYELDGQLVGMQDINNSLWFDQTVELKEEGLNRLVNSYFCEPYSADFLNHPVEVSKKFNQYLDDKTRGLIKPDFNFDNSTRLVIANTLYMKDIWNEFGYGLSKNYKATFANYDGSTKVDTLMVGKYEQGLPYEDETFTSFYAETTNGFKLRFIVPKDNFTVDEIFTKENIFKAHNASYVKEDVETNTIYLTRPIFPEFEVGCDQELIPLFKERGVHDFFYNSDFSNITDERLYCSNIKHISKLKVLEKGIEGAAVTVIVKATSSYPGDYTFVYKDYVVDKAFGFELSNPNDIPLFTGILSYI